MWYDNQKAQPDKDGRYLILCSGFYRHEHDGPVYVQTEPYHQIAIWFDGEFQDNEGHVIAWQFLTMPEWCAKPTV